MRMGAIESVKQATLTLEVDDVRALLGALSYYNSSAYNNFQAGYEPGNPEDQELQREHQRACQIEESLNYLLIEMDEEV